MTSASEKDMYPKRRQY